jgi:hypothetical protein
MARRYVRLKSSRGQVRAHLFGLAFFGWILVLMTCQGALWSFGGIFLLLFTVWLACNGLGWYSAYAEARLRCLRMRAIRAQNP